jgi:hypothetical protein
MPHKKTSGGFTFEYVGLVYGYVSPWIWEPPPYTHVNIFGRIVEGEVWQGDAVSLPMASGASTEGVVSMFMESLYEWMGLPFYYRIDRETMPDPFCLVVAFEEQCRDLICPSIARGFCGTRQEPK